MAAETEISAILQRAGSGDRSAAADLFPLVYDELRKRAQMLMARERPDHTLQATELVHEAFVKIVSGLAVNWEGRRHLYNAVTNAMRMILVDYARQRQSQKRGGEHVRVEFDHADAVEAEEGVDYGALDAALSRLQELDERRYRVVMYRYFSGLREQEIADLLQLTVKTVQRDWKIAQQFLAAEIRQD
jgi:RNA polymerase sigma factor (TIGR02999 family)